MACGSNGAGLSARAEFDELLRALAYPPGVGGSIKAAIRRVSRVTGFPFNRTREFWYGRGVIRAEEMETVREAVRRMRGRNDAGRGQSLEQEIEDLKARIAEIEARLQ